MILHIKLRASSQVLIDGFNVSLSSRLNKQFSKSYRSAISVQRLHRISQSVDLVYGTIRNKSFSHL